MELFIPRYNRPFWQSAWPSKLWHPEPLLFSFFCWPSFWWSSSIHHFLFFSVTLHSNLLYSFIICMSFPTKVPFANVFYFNKTTDHNFSHINWLKHAECIIEINKSLDWTMFLIQLRIMKFTIQHPFVLEQFTHG